MSFHIPFIQLHLLLHFQPHLNDDRIDRILHAVLVFHIMLKPPIINYQMHCISFDSQAYTVIL